MRVSKVSSQNFLDFRNLIFVKINADLAEDYISGYFHLSLIFLYTLVM